MLANRIRRWLWGDLEEKIKALGPSIRLNHSVMEACFKRQELHAPVRCLVVDSREIIETAVVETLVVQHVRPWWREHAGIDIGVWVESFGLVAPTLDSIRTVHLEFDNHGARTLFVFNELAHLPWLCGHRLTC